MNVAAISHQGRGIDCFALDTRTFRIRLTVARGDFDRVELCYALNKYAWDTQRRVEPMRLRASDALRDFYELDVSGEDTRLAYLFILWRGRRRWYFSEEGLQRTCDFASAHHIFFQYPYIHACDVHRTVSWADTAALYQIFPERFANGLGDKPYVDTPWDGEPTPQCYMGGDLPGIEAHLDYLTDLGINCLYMTPIHPSATNHKYSVIDYTDVDAGFGGRAAFRSLVEAAHRRGIRVLLDGVFNHCSLQFPPFADVVRRGKASPYWDFFFIEGDAVDLQRVNYKTFGAVPEMPKLNTANPEVIRYFCEIGAMWVREYGIDGWRLDVMDELSAEFLRAFRRAVKAVNPDALLLGETWHEPRGWLQGDQLDGVMNYGVTKALMDYLVSRTLDAAGMAGRLARLYLRTSSPSARMMMNLIGSHDTARFLTLLGGDVRRLKLAYCVLFFYVGIPCVYYGDEIGMQGESDPGCRRGFVWDEAQWDSDLRGLVRTLCRLRTSGLLAGDEIDLRAEGQTLIITRPRARLLVNAGDTPASLVLDGRPYALDACSYIIETQA